MVMYIPQQFLFNKAFGYDEVEKIRKPETRDIVKRLGVLSPDKVFLRNHPRERPITIFNASVYVDKRRYLAKVFARIILGYYMYISSIVEINIPLDHVLSGTISRNKYMGHIVVYPSTKYDIWGVEDPRVYMINNKLYMTYTGRTKNYFSEARYWKTVPVTAVNDSSRGWVKRYVITLEKNKFPHLISDKDAFFHITGDTTYFFHRPHLDNDGFHLLVSKIDSSLMSSTKDIKEIPVRYSIELFAPAFFEKKIGWASAPITLSSNRVLALLHGVDNDIEAYRVFATLLHISKNEVTVEAVTPTYIMEPRESYEVIGDRPFVVFPCGLWRLNKEELLISYGAADNFVGLGLIKLGEILGELDKGRIY